MQEFIPSTRPIPTTRASRGSKAVRVAIAAAVITVTMASASPAGAISPAQSSSSGTVWLLGGPDAGSIERFWATTFNAWGLTYVTPPVYWYNRWDGDHLMSRCGSTAPWLNNGFHCPDDLDHRTYLDYRYMQSLHNELGDYAVGGFLAHEWGHAIQHILGYENRGFRSEYHADCLAGMYTRWGYATGRLTGGDYWEFHNWLTTRPWSASHGTGSERAGWYYYGYSQYSLAACNRVFSA